MLYTGTIPLAGVVVAQYLGALFAAMGSLYPHDKNKISYLSGVIDF